MNTSPYIEKYNVESKTELATFLNNFSKDSKIRVLILSFNSKKSFENKEIINNKIYESLENLTIPIIAIVNQNVFGFLFEIVKISHICFASENIFFTVNNTKKNELEISKTNKTTLNSIEETFDAKTAYSLGIINKVCKSETIEKDAFEMAENISKLAPIAIKSCLEAVNQGLKTNLKEGLELETKLFNQIFATEDMREGTKAFLEKRNPVFSGK